MRSKRAGRSKALLAALVVAWLTPATGAGQNMYKKDAPVEKGARSWIAERAALPPFTAPRTPWGEPDLQGFFETEAMGDEIEEHPYTDVTTPPQESFLSDPPDGKIPYQPWALATRNRFRAGLGRGWPGETGENLHVDPQTFCFTNVPRAAYRGNFQIVQTPGQFVFLLEWGHFHRVVPTRGGRSDLAPDVKLWLGQSRGRWEGDTLVVDVTNLNGKLWLDSVGNFYSDTARITERWRLVSPDAIDYQVTIEDPRVYTRPWTMTLPFRRRQNPDEPWEHACHEGEKDSAKVRELGYKPFWGVTPPEARR